MKNTQLISEGNWKSLYGKEMTGIKKFKRKGREPVKHVNGLQHSDTEEEGGDSGGAFPEQASRSRSRSRSASLERLHERASRGESLERLHERASRSASLERLHERASRSASLERLHERASRGESLERLHERASDGDRTAQPRRDSNTAIDMRIGSLSAAPGHRSRPSSPASPMDPFRSDSPQGAGFEPFSPDLAYPSRIVLCPRSSERCFASSVPPAAYLSPGGERAASPRKRPGEPPGVVTEIKAIQQTRRLLANARERTRVHTISAAFEALRKQVPCYSYGQKLSKLAILRIACNYILSLAQLAELDYTPDHSNVSFAECVEQCTRTLQAEGRSKKRKE
ncbi:hypothetical protein AAFF_G00290110 [Aldrovandia affinis]|uniref:Protein atonal homolog 8 n=1 Tax=Aldrovandia affinis TaxID=143900 RepID=A0AAD7W1N7_9TELE|nr:hypothetical protein AAFF_G00290110 [Aldrovandia affinis]